MTDRARTGAGVVACLVIGALFAACDGRAIATPTPLASETPGPSATTAPAGTLDPDVTASPPPDAPIVDAALLDVLPDGIDGFPLTADDETAGQIAADPTTDAAVDRLAVAVYVDPSDPVETDLAVVSVVALAPDTFDDTWFRSWRDSYDAAACEVAGGLAAAGVETTIDGRATYIGTCEAGVHTYHVHLADPDRVVAVTAVGPARFGERVVAGLEE